jgi:hypothetical protein
MQYHDVWKHDTKLDSSKGYRELYDEENTPFVCIAAAAATETAWEYRNSRGEWCGVLTEALVKVLSNCKNRQISWKASLYRISELISITFPDQHPRLNGPGQRHQFSLRQSMGEGLHIRNEAYGAVIQAGTVSGVLQGNVYTIMSLGSDFPNRRQQLAEARVVEATAFRAVAHLQQDITSLPSDGATAFLKSTVLPKWPVEIPSGVPWLNSLVGGSKFVRPQGIEDSGLALARFALESDTIALYTNRGLEAMRCPINAPSEEQSNLLKAVEQLGRAQHILGLKNETDDEYLQHDIRLQFGIVEHGSTKRMIRDDGTDSITEGNRICIQLANCGLETVYITILNINALGRVSRVSRIDGIELPPGRDEIVPRNNSAGGLLTSWPKSLSRGRSVEDTLVFILTGSPVDLSHLCTPTPDPLSKRGRLSSLAQLTWTITSGCDRNIKGIEDEDNLRFATHKSVFTLCPAS